MNKIEWENKIDKCFVQNNSYDYSMSMDLNKKNATVKEIVNIIEKTLEEHKRIVEIETKNMIYEEMIKKSNFQSFVTKDKED